jgi:type II secretory pathway pseudopilin PulG
LFFLREEDGLTLIEVMLALIILTAVILPLMGHFGRLLQMQRQVEVREKALYIAQQTIEEYRAMDFNSITTGSLSVVLTSTSHPQYNLDNYPAFKREIVITEPVSNIKDIEVNVKWGQDWDKNINLKTRIAGRQ